VTKKIITHTSPDFDAIAFLWLMVRFASGFDDAAIEFMPLNAIDEEKLATADAVGDMGKIYDPENLRFDHHHLSGNQSITTCAAMQTFEWLLFEGYDLEYLWPLIKEIHQGDLAKTPLVGIHSQLFGWKSSAKEAGIEYSDEEIYSYGAHILSQIEFWLKRKAESRKELEKKVVWKSPDNSVWAIIGGSTSVSFAAYEEGARIIVFEGEPIVLNDGSITYPVGASRSPEWGQPHLGEIVETILASDYSPNIKDELSAWFRHNAGFFAGRGTPKAPNGNPLKVRIEEIAKVIYWECDMDKNDDKNDEKYAVILDCEGVSVQWFDTIAEAREFVEATGWDYCTIVKPVEQ
jgi:hypothetical protein